MHPLEEEPVGRGFLSQLDQSLPLPHPPPPSGRATKISLSISVVPAPFPSPSVAPRSALVPRRATFEDGMSGRERWRERNADREKGAMAKERVKGTLSQQKERKATQMLVIVLGERNRRRQ